MIRLALRHFGWEPRLPFLPPLGTQEAGRTLPAAVSPRMEGAAFSEITAMGAFHDQGDKLRPAQLMCQLKAFGFAFPHERRFQNKSPLHAEIQRKLHGFDGIVAAIGVAGEVRLAHSAHDPAQPSAVSDRRGGGKEQQIAPRHKGIGKPFLGKTNIGLLCKRRCSHRFHGAGEIHHMVGSEPLPPIFHLRELRTDRAAAGQLHQMALTVGEAYGFHPRIPSQRPSEADGGILPARK